MTCSSCGRAAAILLTHTLRIGKRVIVWSECSSCYRKAEANP
jgi:bacterioferritin-associated ferredoxin